MSGDATQAEAVQAALKQAAELDREWMTSPAGRDDPNSTSWMPFPVFDFIALVAEALAQADGYRFLEIGCGIGTRMLLAQEIYGLDVQGIDRVAEYLNQAAKLGLDVMEADALKFTGYGDYDILWFNRPFLNRDLERQLEGRVWNSVKTGAVVICANLETIPPPRGWYLILDDSEVRRWIWQKIPVS